MGVESEIKIKRMERRNEIKGEGVRRKDEGQFGSLLQQSVQKRRRSSHHSKKKEKLKRRVICLKR